MIATAARLTLTAALLFGVWTETGPWTTVALALTVVGFEAITRLIRDLREPDEFQKTIAALFAPPPPSDDEDTDVG